jgi:nicotinamide-nucleotide amidase
MLDRRRKPKVGITVSSATISLRITATSESDQQCLEMIRRTRREILDRAGEYYFGDGEHFEQHHAIDQEMRRRDESLAIVELGNAAPLGDWFASLGQTSSYRGGVSLAVVDDLLRLCEADDLAPALNEMREKLSGDWLLMVDAYPALPIEEGSTLPASEVRFWVCDPGGRCLSTASVLGGHPSILHARIAKAAMRWLRKVLAEEPMR